MPRYRIVIEYDGTPFVGWQRQLNGPSVESALAAAILAFSGEAVDVRGAGRTDAGVHAAGQVAHFDLQRSWAPGRIADAINHYLRPNPVAVLACDEAASDFDARFSATRRSYRYRILCRRAPPVIERDRVWWVAYPLDVEAMADAAQVLTGHHDFTTFRAVACQAKSPVKTLDMLRVTRAGDAVHIDTAARSFLHNQVRSMAGSLKLVGAGRWSKADLAAALAARNRAACGPVAPPQGLYLMSVGYDPL